jgi:uncharacterized membrane protein
MIKQITTILNNELKQTRFYIILLFVFAYCMISLVNHYNFRTYAYDLGIYNNSIYQYSHLINNHHPYGHIYITNFLGDHFALYTIILSPLYYLFGSYTLLYVQIASIIFGGIGIYKLVKCWHPNSYIPEIALFHFFCFYGIFSALSFDYHDNVVGTMFVPWFIYFIHLNKLKYAALMALIIAIGKENMPIWLFSICLGLIVLYRNDKKRRTFALITGILSLVYAFIIVSFVIPSFLKPGQNVSHFTYSVLGENSSQILETVIYKTKYLVTALFCNINGITYDDGVKEETYMCLLLSGGLALFLRIEYAIMLLSIIAQKVLSDDVGKWGINCHYSIEFAPIVVIAFYSSLNYFENIKFKIGVSLFFCLLTYSTTFGKFFTRTSHWYSPIQNNPFLEAHYKSEFDKTDVDKIIDMIPEKAKLSSNSCFGPHVAFRKYIYLFPDVYDAEYIFVADVPYEFPLSGEALHNEIMFYKNSANWETVTKINSLYLFKKAK